MTHSKNPLRLLLDRCSRLRTRAMNRNPWQPAARKTPNVEPRSIGFGSKSPTLFRSPERRAQNISGVHRRLRGPWPEALRWAPHYRPYPDALPRHCLLATATNRAGEIIGLQSTELDPLTGTKAEKVAKPRLSRGPVGEGSVFLGNRLAPAPTLVIGEGLETTLTRSLIAPCDAHACLGAVRFIEPAPHHTRVEILADSDKRDAARRLARQYAKDGRAAFVVTVPDSLEQRPTSMTRFVS